MGCTSSAPNMVSSSTAEKSIQSEEETTDDQSKDTEEIIYRAGNDTNDITVLPPCDIITEPNIHVVRNRSTPNLKTEKENQEDGHTVNETDSRDIRNEKENPPKLEQLVQKAVELNSSENINETLPDSKKPDKTAEQPQISHENKNNSNISESNVLQDNEEHTDVEQDKKKDDHPEESVSPSQSESSRATRWEALADIAAELPPSLTVDPLTGQIYALSK